MIKILNLLGEYLDVPFSDEFFSKTTEDELRRIRLVNYISFITIGNMLSYVVLYALVDFPLFKPACIFLSVASLITLGIIVINKRGNHFASKILLSLLTPLYMSYIAIVVFGKAPGFQVYLFVAAIIPLFLWNYKHRIYPIVIIAAILSLYAFIEFSPHSCIRKFCYLKTIFIFLG